MKTPIKVLTKMLDSYIVCISTAVVFHFHSPPNRSLYVIVTVRLHEYLTHYIKRNVKSTSFSLTRKLENWTSVSKHASSRFTLNDISHILHVAPTLREAVLHKLLEKMAYGKLHICVREWNEKPEQWHEHNKLGHLKKLANLWGTQLLFADVGDAEAVPVQHGRHAESVWDLEMIAKALVYHHLGAVETDGKAVWK